MHFSLGLAYGDNVSGDKKGALKRCLLANGFQYMRLFISSEVDFLLAYITAHDFEFVSDL